MALGMILGAWLYHRGGWHALWWGAGAVAMMSILDASFGQQVGRYVGEAMRDALWWGTP